MNAVPTSSAEAEREADALRRELAGTLDRLKDNLRPARLANEAWLTTRSHTPEWLERYWAFAQSPAGLALIGAAGVSLVGGLLARRRVVGRPLFRR